MSDDLPKEFDLVVIGTGFTESCIAAAASRIGKTVLHIDPNDFYGGVWASFTLKTLNEYLEKVGNGQELRNASYKWHTPAENPPPSEPETNQENMVTQQQLLDLNRRFSIDLSPKLMYSAGKLVQLLVSSNICRYAEFRAVDKVCTLFKGQVLNVPCSRSDVFNTKDLNIVEKRLLMKFLSACMDVSEESGVANMDEHNGKTFQEFLQKQKLTEKIASCVMQAIAMCNSESSFEEGMARTQQFLGSLGRYGNTPFLFPMYGCGEIPQCFCRLCAVFGGIYCLKKKVLQIDLNSQTNSASILLQGIDGALKAKKLVCSHGNIPESLQQENIYDYGSLKNNMSRGIFIASSPLGSEELNSGGGGVNLLRLIEGNREATLLQLSHYSGTCPLGFYLFHLTTTALSNQPEEDLKPFISQVFDNSSNAPQILYSAFFSITSREPLIYHLESSPYLVFCTKAPHYELDYDENIKNAEEIFAKLYVNAEFLPRAPDPEEIVIEGEDPRALNEVSLPDDLREQLHELEKATAQMDIDDSNLQAKAENMIAEQMDADEEMHIKTSHLLNTFGKDAAADEMLN